MYNKILFLYIFYLKDRNKKAVDPTIQVEIKKVMAELLMFSHLCLISKEIQYVIIILYRKYHTKTYKIII